MMGRKFPVGSISGILIPALVLRHQIPSIPTSWDPFTTAQLVLQYYCSNKPYVP